MSKNWILLTGLLFLGSAGTLQAHPLDSPDIVYIDGLPCNSACQTYMAWSRRPTSPVAEQPAPAESARVQSRPLKLPENPGLRPARRAARHAKEAQRESSKPAARRTARRAIPLPRAKIAEPKLAGDAAVNSEPAPGNVGTLSSSFPDGAAAASETMTAKEQVTAADAGAEQATSASASPVPQQEAADSRASNAEPSVGAAGANPDDAQPTTPSAATSSTENRVAVLATRPEIESVSDLAGKDIAIEDQQSASSTSIRDAIASAGATEVKLNEGPAKAIDRLVGGEVPAAILALLSPEAAETFPDVPGYRIFRIPLSPDPSKS